MHVYGIEYVLYRYIDRLYHELVGPFVSRCQRHRDDKVWVDFLPPLYNMTDTIIVQSPNYRQSFQQYNEHNEKRQKRANNYFIPLTLTANECTVYHYTH